MVTARVQSVDQVGELPSENAGSDPLLRIETDLPLGQNNAFYIPFHDLEGKPVAKGDFTPGDLILFDMWDGPIHKRVSWMGRGFRQRADSFDWGDEQHTNE